MRFKRPKLLAILGYHSIGPPAPGGWTTWFYVPTATFAGHLGSLQGSGWQIINLRDLLHGLQAPADLPDRAALITFDDGYRSMRTVTLPILMELACPAVVFVPTEFIGSYNAFEPDGWAPREAICDWDDLEALERAGVSVQSHGVSHRSLSQLAESERNREFRESKAILESRLRTPVQMFSYPYGDVGTDPHATEVALRSAGYRSACLYDGRVNRLQEANHVNVFRLSRLQMGPDTDLQGILRAELAPL